jgi:Plasmid pRiA4b ORF-3-like protein
VIVWGPSVYTLKVSLLAVEPTVWRRIVVPSETKLSKFARWFGAPDDDADHVIDERRVTVKQVLPRVGSALQWDYDFGDGWEHDVEVEAIEEPSATVKYPVCLDGQRACPPEDCGGPQGYADLLAVLADPTHEEYEHLSGWAPPGFDAERFDLVAANRRLRR